MWLLDTKPDLFLLKILAHNTGNILGVPILFQTMTGGCYYLRSTKHHKNVSSLPPLPRRLTEFYSTDEQTDSANGRCKDDRAGEMDQMGKMGYMREMGRIPLL